MYLIINTIYKTLRAPQAKTGPSLSESQSPYRTSAQTILVSSGCEQLVTEVPEIHFSAFEEWDYALET